MNKELLKLLACPEDHSRLSLADEALLAEVNQAISAGSLKNKAGQTVSTPLSDGLVRADRSILYPVVDGIPMMLVDEAIEMSNFAVNSRERQA